jgi:transposase
MPKALPLRLRINIVVLHEQKWDERAIARELKVSRSAVKHWIAEWDSGGDMEEKPRPGRPPMLATAATKFVYKQLKKPGFGGLDHAAALLHKHGHTATVVHRSTLSRMLKLKAWLLPSRLVPDLRRPTWALTAHDKERRLAFAHANRERDWSNVMFTDRKRFYFRYPGSKVARVQWHEPGQRREVFKPTSPQCVNVYMGITQYGATTAVVVAGSSKHKSIFLTKQGKPARNITAAEYEYVMLHHLLPEGQELMKAAGHREWWFQQDNDPCHRLGKAHTETFRASSGGTCKFLPNWPPHSPDLNLIENVWADVQAAVESKGYKGFQIFLRRLIRALGNVPQERLAEAFRGMAKRIEETIQAGGDRTKH